jgi:hypothetical protein
MERLDDKPAALITGLSDPSLATYEGIIAKAAEHTVRALATTYRIIVVKSVEPVIGIRASNRVITIHRQGKGVHCAICQSVEQRRSGGCRSCNLKPRKTADCVPYVGERTAANIRDQTA